MINTKPQVEIDGIYTISQASKALKVDRHTLLRYVEKGLIDTTIRKFDKKRVMKGKAIVSLWEEMEE